VVNSKPIEIPVWWKCGGMIYNRDALPINHPENTYNYIKNVLGLIPEDYGVYHPINEKYKHYTKEQLLSRITELEESNENS
jgi:hypothetical protein